MPHTVDMPAREGTLLRIDLDDRSVRLETITTNVMEAFIGGRGLAAWRLWQSAAVAQDDPRMPILLFAGPLVGTGTPAAGRLAFMTRSPYTGAVLSETGGGSFAASLRAAGLDGIEIVGRSASSLGIVIDNDRVAFADAAGSDDISLDLFPDLWPGFSTIAAGPAARAGVGFASLVIDRRFGVWRGGPGAAFARKNLSFIAVRGDRVSAVADESTFSQACADIRRLTAASPVLSGEHGFSKRGNATLYDLINARHMLPTRNFIRTHFAAGPRLNAVAMNAAFTGVAEGCAGCHIHCKRRTPEGLSLPGFESLAHFTALLENNDLATAVEADRICRRAGMDPVSCAATIACFAEIEDVVLRPADILSLVNSVASASGDGMRLKDGAVRFANSSGAGALSMTVKNLELSAFDPRGATGLALAVATATRGGCHFEAYPIGTEILRKPVATDRFSFSGKARIQKINEDRNAAGDALGICRYQFLASSLEEYGRALSAVTRRDISPAALFDVGARICYLERMLNRRFGVLPSSDTLPVRFFRESGTEGPDFKVPAIDCAAFEEARSRYYAIRGLSSEGFPERAEAERLGLPWTM